MKETIKRALRILNWKKGTKGMTFNEKIIGTLYYPIICIMWWTIFMWKKEYQ